MRVLEHKSDLELRFDTGENIPVHSLRLSLASIQIRIVLDDVVEPQIESAKSSKKRRADDGSTGDWQKPHIQVIKSDYPHFHYATVFPSIVCIFPCNLLHCMHCGIQEYHIQPFILSPVHAYIPWITGEWKV